MKKFMNIIALMAVVLIVQACGDSAPLTEITISGFTEPKEGFKFWDKTVTPDSVKLVARDINGKLVTLASTAYNKNGFTLTLPQDMDMTNLQTSFDKVGNRKITHLTSYGIFLYANGEGVTTM